MCSRTGNKGLAAATLIGDMLKGTVAVIVAGHFAGPNAAIAAGLGAFLGHLFPIWLKFKGGKGVATYIGVLLGLFWPAALAFCAIWLAVAFIFRYSSLAALIASAVIPLMLFWSQHQTLAAVFAVLSAHTVVHAPCQHQAAARRHRRQNRAEGLAICQIADASSAQYRDALVSKPSKERSNMLHLRVSGSPDQPAIVFLHALATSGWMWGEQTNSLQDFHCIVPDLPGHGDSRATSWRSP